MTITAPKFYKLVSSSRIVNLEPQSSSTLQVTCTRTATTNVRVTVSGTIVYKQISATTFNLSMSTSDTLFKLHAQQGTGTDTAAKDISIKPTASHRESMSQNSTVSIAVSGTADFTDQSKVLGGYSSTSTADQDDPYKPLTKYSFSIAAGSGSIAVTYSSTEYDIVSNNAVTISSQIGPVYPTGRVTFNSGAYGVGANTVVKPGVDNNTGCYWPSLTVGTGNSIRYLVYRVYDHAPSSWFDTAIDVKNPTTSTAAKTVYYKAGEALRGKTIYFRVQACPYWGVNSTTSGIADAKTSSGSTTLTSAKINTVPSTTATASPGTVAVSTPNTLTYTPTDIDRSLQTITAQLYDTVQGRWVDVGALSPGSSAGSTITYTKTFTAPEIVNCRVYDGLEYSPTVAVEITHDGGQVAVFDEQEDKFILGKVYYYDATSQTWKASYDVYTYDEDEAGWVLSVSPEPDLD